jgi:hypothetical protein
MWLVSNKGPHRPQWSGLNFASGSIHIHELDNMNVTSIQNFADHAIEDDDAALRYINLSVRLTTEMNAIANLSGAAA